VSADTSVGAKKVKFDENVYNVTVKVVKDRNGIYTVDETLIVKNNTTEAQDTIEFTNVYAGNGVMFWIGIVACAISAAGAIFVLVSRIKRARVKTGS
jgi:hypothetical protein